MRLIRGRNKLVRIICLFFGLCIWVSSVYGAVFPAPQEEIDSTGHRVPVVARSCMECCGIATLPADREISDARNRINIAIAMLCGGCIGTINSCELLPPCTIPCQAFFCGIRCITRIPTSFLCGIGWCFRSQGQVERRDLDSAIRLRPTVNSVPGVLQMYGCCCTSCAEHN